MKSYNKKQISLDHAEALRLNNNRNKALTIITAFTQTDSDKIRLYNLLRESLTLFELTNDCIAGVIDVINQDAETQIMFQTIRR